ncbi:uncharacterized protein DS421_15g501980 [Arachis hypogaea]|nr:uncharacterized protein DS421_15g501980 [Arachis hypogaea]
MLPRRLAISPSPSPQIAAIKLRPALPCLVDEDPPQNYHCHQAEAERRERSMSDKGWRLGFVAVLLHCYLWRALSKLLEPLPSIEAATREAKPPGSLKLKGVVTTAIARARCCCCWVHRREESEQGKEEGAMETSDVLLLL